MLRSSRDITVLELDGPRLTAASASVAGGRVVVKRWVTAERPSTLAADDAEGLGLWAGDQLREAGLPLSRVVLVAPRSDVVLKSLTLPMPEGGDERDLAEMVRLQMVRQLTMSADTAAIDYAIVGEAPLSESRPPAPATGAASPGSTGAAGAATGPGSGPGITPPPSGPATGAPTGGPTGGSADASGGKVILAGAMPGARLEWYRRFAEAGSFMLARIALRSFGVAALLDEVAARSGMAVLGVAPGAQSAELVVVEGGKLVNARASDVPVPSSRTEIELYAEKLAVESKRTLMSHRAARPEPDVGLIGVLGVGELAKRVAERCAVATGLAAETVAPPDAIDLPEFMPESDRAAVLPLLGLLLEQSSDGRTLDFAHPRRAPDRGARLRQLVLAGLAGALVLGGVGYVVADQKLSGLREQLAALEQQRRDLQGEHTRYLAAHARLGHVRSWSQAEVDWLAHLHHLSFALPDPREGTAKEITGRLRADGTYAPRTSTQGTRQRPLPYPAGTWRTSQEATFKLAGNADRRDLITQLRGGLLEGGIYEVRNVGPDLPDAYSLDLTTVLPRPERPQPPSRNQSPARTQPAGTSGSQGGTP